MKRIKLDDIDRKVPFEVPDHYFDTLPSVIQSRAVQPTPAERHPLGISWSWRRTGLVSMAASIIGLLIWITYPAQQLSLGHEALSQVSDEAIVQYLSKNEQLTPNDFEMNAEAVSLTPDSLLIQQLDISDKDILDELDPEDLKEAI
jgi:hypothetical protein